uniref:CCHC-type domain-containing protein n=1 Tax=Heligmosomoides polygyrus TaxID=6339 RepID=A0A183GMW2_HELPZ
LFMVDKSGYNTTLKSLRIIQVHAPHSSHDDKEYENFLDDLSKIIDLRRNSHLVIIGDFNATPGARQHQERFIGVNAAEPRNSRGSKLAEFYEERRLSIANTFFQKRVATRWTWESSALGLKKEIDYVLVPNIREVKDVKVLASVNAGSDHRLLRCTMQLQQTKRIAQPHRGTRIVDKSMLCLHAQQLMDRIPACNEVNEEYRRLTTIINTATNKATRYDHDGPVVTMRSAARSGSRTWDFEVFKDHERSGSSGPQRSNATAQQTRCFNCEGFGHFSRQCPSPRAQRHESVIHMRHGSDSPDTPVGSLGNCVYALGSCTLADGSALVWVPTQEESFCPDRKMKDHLLGDVWISDSKEFALSWSDKSPRIQDCGDDLVMSDQGYALMTTSRVLRAATPQVGVVTSNQLAAQLLAVEGSVASTTRSGYRNFTRTSPPLQLIRNTPLRLSHSCLSSWVPGHGSTCGILRAVIAIYCSMYFPGGLPSPTDLILSLTRGLAPSPPGSPPPLAITALQPSSRGDLDRRQMDDLTLQLTRLEIDSTSTCPHRVSVTPVKVLALMNHKQFCMAQILL